MKKIIIGLMMLILGVSLVSATYYQVGDTVGLPFLETMETSDLDLSDGMGRYVYCSYALDAPNTDEKCHTMEDIRTGTCDVSIFEPLNWGGSYGNYTGMHTCGLYEPTSPTGAHIPFNINLSNGTTEYAVTITSAEMIFDEISETWMPGEVRLIDSTTKIYKTIPEPSAEFIKRLIDSILAIICKIYPFGYCNAIAPPEEPEPTEPVVIFLTESRSLLPITTWEQAFDLAVAKFGSEEIWNCEREDMIKIPTAIPNGTIPIDEFGNYGYRGTTLINNKTEIVGYSVLFECDIVKEWDELGRPKSGVEGLRFQFDPNNGWIERLICNSIEYENCPKNENGEYIWIRESPFNNPDREKYMELI